MTERSEREHQESAGQDWPALPPGWVWQWVDREGNSYHLDERPPLGGDLCPFAEFGPCEGQGAGDAAGAWRRAYDVVTNRVSFEMKRALLDLDQGLSPRARIQSIVDTLSGTSGPNAEESDSSDGKGATNDR